VTNRPSRIAAAAGTQPDVLQQELVPPLNEDARMSRFGFGVQLLDTEKMAYWGKGRDVDFWIENASINWNERRVPFYIVARLTLLPKSQMSVEVSEHVLLSWDRELHRGQHSPPEHQTRTVAGGSGEQTGTNGLAYAGRTKIGRAGAVTCQPGTPTGFGAFP